MTWPKQTNVPSNRRAKAPYNFVPLPEHVRWAPEDPPGMDRYHEGRYTGWIDCTLTTSSPLYVRSGLTLSEAKAGMEAKDRPEFFYVDPDTREPVIPGSSLRGMLRTLTEIVTSSKVQPVTDDQLVYRAVADTSSLGEGYRSKLLEPLGSRKYGYRMKAGYMRKRGRGWRIVPAQPINGESFVRIEQRDIPNGLERWHRSRNASICFVDVAPVRDHSHNKGRVILRYAKVRSASGSPGSGRKKGVLVRTGWIPRKHMEFVFGPPEEDKSLTVDEDVVATYREQITDKQQELLGENAALRDWQPVFYLEENDAVVFFGHAMMLRLPYDNTPDDCVPDALTDPEQTDLTEALFGYVDEEAEERPVHRAGRLSVSDATLEPGQDGVWLSEEPIVPRILASPKPTTFQHYLVQMESGKKQLRHYNSSTPKETVIRGHKLYWHKGDVTRQEFEEQAPVDEGDTQHTEMRPVRSGVRFQCRTRFENVSAEELGALMWILDLGADEDMRLKLGMGKPLGLGAVKVEYQVQLTDRAGGSGRYSQLFDGGAWEEGRLSAERLDKELREAKEAFQNWMLPDKKTAVLHLRRMQRLKALLSWPGPSPRETRYLRIEPHNEYRSRPVLPDPLSVAAVKRTAKDNRPETVTQSDDDERESGRVKWFSDEKGYGFITCDGRSDDAFVHHSDVRGSQKPTLREGQRVKFSVQRGPKGLKAQNVEVVG